MTSAFAALPLWQQCLIAVFALLVALAGIKLFASPLKWALKAALNTVFGFMGLFVFNMAGAAAGLSLGLNWINAAVIGVLGLPGFALLLLTQWLWKI